MTLSGPPTDSAEASLLKTAMRRILAGTFIVATLLYPFLVYWGLGRFRARGMALLLLAVFLARWFLPGTRSTQSMFLPVTAVAVAVCLLVFFNRDPGYFLYYPMAVNLVLLGVFAFSLRRGRPVIERFARIMEPELPDYAVGYCRKVTLVWCGFFALNGSISLATAVWGTVRAWTLYNGLISYGLIAALFAGEYAVRRRFRRKHARVSSPGNRPDGS